MKYFVTKFSIRNIDGNIPDGETLEISRELVAALAGTANYESFEDKEYGIDGYVQQDFYNEELLRQCLATIPMDNINVTFTTEEAEQKNWNQEWEDKGFEPIVVAGKCRIHDSHHKAAPSDAYPIDIEIDARQAFGTGTHNTTQMIVAYLTNADLDGKTVLDCGCGTGILSIAACKMGCKKAVGYDIDEWSTENTMHNARINGVNQITALLGDSKALDTIGDKFDIVLANINRNILLADLPKMVVMLKPEGKLVVSGFYTEDANAIVSKSESLGMKLSESAAADNWCMLVFEKTTDIK